MSVFTLNYIVYVPYDYLKYIKTLKILNYSKRDNFERNCPQL